MFDFFKGNKAMVQLGDKRVEVPKLTRAKLKQLTNHIGVIGDFLVKIFLTPPEQRATFIVAAADVAIDEIYELTSILSGVPVEYLDEKAAIGECTEYLRLTWEKNDLNAALGNVSGLLHPMAKTFVESTVKRMEKAGG